AKPHRPVHRFDPVPRQFDRFFIGSFATRFSGQTEPHTWPVPGPTGRPVRSGSDNIAPTN
ncbi:hypothetical protein A2U01_0068265, partial [Trifolium medium]|nr:hypothetical protein [Trifolium medium]